EQVHVLLVFQKCAVQRRDQAFGVALAQGLGRDVLDHQEFQPVKQLGGRWFFLHAGNVADLVEQPQRFGNQALLDAGKMYLDDGAHGVGVGKADVVKEAAAQKCVRQLLFVVGGDDHDR